MKIPLKIPPETPKLQHLSTLEGWEDAPHAITEIRNSLIHPKDKSMGDMKAALDEAWNLSLWYLEMSILAICGYYGTYSNRLKQPWIGQTEDVPWKR